jgi:hypothetical protein
LDEVAAWEAVTVIKLMTGHRRWFKLDEAQDRRAYVALRTWLRDNEAQAFLGINRHQGILWFRRESFDELLWWMLVTAVVEIGADPDHTDEEVIEEIVAAYDLIDQLREAEAVSRYQVEELLEAART